MTPLDHLRAEIAAIPRVRRIGRIARLDRGLVTLHGLSDLAAPGDLVELHGDSGPAGAR